METLCADGKDNEGGEVASDWLDIEIRILNGIRQTEMHMEMHMEISHKYLSMIIRSRIKPWWIQSNVRMKVYLENNCQVLTL